MRDVLNGAGGVVIRDMRAGDIAAGLQLCRASGWNQLERDWRLFLELSPAGCRVAETDGDVVGTVATLRYEDRFSWLAMVLVDPRRRRAGIGTRLLYEGLALLEHETCVRLDATAAGRELYRQHGFRDEYPISRYAASANGVQRAAAIGGNVRRMSEGDLPAIFDRDRFVFGADRQVVLRSLFARSPECAWVAGDKDIQGYCFGRPGFLYQQLGPIVADNEAVASDLVSQCLVHAGGDRFGIDAPQHSPAWLGWLQSSGFVKERAFMRMHLGEHRFGGCPERVFAVAGPEFG